MTDASVVVLDAERFYLRERPSSSSRVVRTARDQLLCELDLSVMGEDLGRVAKLVAIARSSAYAAGYAELAEHISAVSEKVVKLFDTTGLAIAKFQAAAEAVLEEIALNHDMMAQRKLDEAMYALESNDELALELADASRELSEELASAADDTSVALEKAQMRQSERDEDKKLLEDRMTDLRIRKAHAWETHGMMLESLSEAGRLYSHAARKERSAARRARVFGVFGFVSHIDSFFQTRLNWAFLAPVSEFLQSIQANAGQARIEKEALMDAKRRQRNLNREALSDITDCSARIREVKSDVDAVMAAIESLHAVASELKRLSVVVMSISSFWSQVHANMGRLSSNNLVKLIVATSQPSPFDALNETVPASGSAGTAGTPKSTEIEETTMDDDSGPSPGNTVPHADGHYASTIAVAGASRSSSTMSELNASGARAEWVPCTAVKRKLVLYYGRWVALADVCRDCLREISTARASAIADAETQAPTVVMSPELAREQVNSMAADLRKEMLAINEELKVFRAGLEGAPGASSSFIPER